MKISWVNDRHKLISNDGGNSFELYDLTIDRVEKENLVQKRSEIAKMMKKELFEWMHSVEESKRGLDYD